MAGDAPAELYAPAFNFGAEPQPLLGLAEWINGLAFKNIAFTDDGLPVAKIAEIKGGFSDATKRTNGIYDNRVRLRDGDLLFCWSGQPETSIGTFVWDKGDAWLNQHIFRVLPRKSVDRRFFRFLMLYLQPNFQEIARNKQTTGLGHVTKGDLSMMMVQLPGRAEQQRIADVLQAIQDKLDLNRQIAMTLEDTARALFKSWFVDFDPVHAKSGGRDPGLPTDVAALFPDGFDDGGLPNGWEWGSPESLVKINPTTRIDRNKEAPYVDMAALPTKGHRIVSAVSRPVGSGARFKNGDTLLARITPCLENGKSALVDCLDHDAVAWGSTEFIVMRPLEGIPEPLPYLVARDASFRAHMISAMSGTSGRQRAPAEAIDRWAMAIPNAAVIAAWGNAVVPMFNGIKARSLEAEQLTELRDTLLPKLLSGKLRLADTATVIAAA
ncbi:restriction endonuclease subunit S [Sphingomonas sp. ASY06-1R]|uniref:restriction endonuclease subunit S n=1 Tax=Sphingomonas sp. ASY06-1R TaxID=3445771 RepID=UPI003FA1CC59